MKVKRIVGNFKLAYRIHAAHEINQINQINQRFVVALKRYQAHQRQR